MRISQTFVKDAIERCLSTYLQVVIPALTVSVFTDWNQLRVVLLSGVPALLSVIKSILAEKYAPGTVSPASLAKS